ncbi:hypothetical protein V496_05249 [Pseudogymnoascus sp. VKM F-4515 (FW-2607)]|nr:hypothetical protein V496_05249 [Pseudogymnoascus sp. VKM F-4515 (FW-2607)]
MAAHPGEEVTATLFADVHYFYGPPTAKPPHHRFDKGSYLYLYENAAQRRARVEVANSAGTPDQDAFDGPLDNVLITYDHKHPTLLTITIDAFPPLSPQSPNDFRLPTYDPRNETKYLYRLHTIDVYLYTPPDATLLLTTLQRLLPANHFAIAGAILPPPPHAQAMSPIVQQLENIAIKEHSPPQFAGPPTSTPPASTSPPAAQSFAPLAYNPAAPAAPEAIAHREKTPPPPDAGPNPLLAAAAHEHHQQQQQQQFQPAAPAGGAVYFPGPPSATGGQYAPSASPAAPHPGSTPAAPAAATAPAGGFANYSYAQGGQPAQGQGEYNVHQQVYRPTEGEAMGKVKPVEGEKSKLGQNAVRLEKGVTGFLKKFEKKYG